MTLYKKDFQRRLLRTWIIVEILPVAIIAILYVLREYGVIPVFEETQGMFSVTMLFLSAVSIGSVLLALLYHFLFVRAYQEKRTIPSDAFYRFMNNNILLAPFPLYSLIAALLLNLDYFDMLLLLLPATYMALRNFPSLTSLSKKAEAVRAQY